MFARRYADLGSIRLPEVRPTERYAIDEVRAIGGNLVAPAESASANFCGFERADAFRYS